MKRIQFFIPFLLTLFIAAIFISPAQAQTAPTEEPVCRDAAGGVIPCPPTPEPEAPTAVPTSAPANPTAAPTSAPTSAPPRPTATPISIIAPTEEPDTDKAEWSGECKGDFREVSQCIAIFHNGCNHVGGTVSSTIKDGEASLTCTVQSTVDPGSRFTAAGEDGSEDGASWSGECKGDFREVSQCIAIFHNGCNHVGGTVSSTIKDGEASLTCTVQSTVDPGSRFTAADHSQSNEDGFLGSCTNKNLAECREVFTCEEGLLVIKVDLYATGGTRYDFYCIPHDSRAELPLAVPSDDGETDNWGGECFAEGKELDQCIDALSAFCGTEGGDVSVLYWEDGASVYCENMSEAAPPAPTETPLPVAAAPQEPVEPNPAPGGTFPPGGWLPWMTGLFGLAIGLLLPAVQKLANKPEEPEKLERAGIFNLTDNPDEGSTEAKKIFIGGLSAQPEPPQPQTREHILLSNQSDEPQEAFDPFTKVDGIPGHSKDTQPAPEDSIGREDVIKREDKDKG